MSDTSEARVHAGQDVHEADPLRFGRLGMVALALLGLLAVAIFVKQRDEVVLAPLPPIDFEALPDFGQFERVQDKKARFFEYLEPMVRARNARIRRLREELVGARARLASGDGIGDALARRIERLAERYEVASEGPVDAELIGRLLRRVDELPPSLVLAQAATESAWGTSRFAREANNLFGQWCYTPGCGVVPGRRAAGATHEVKAFDSVYESVEGYFLNLNTHPAYADVRALRARSRTQGESLSGAVLAGGLDRYSERGRVYVDEVRAIIRSNGLGRLDAPQPTSPATSSTTDEAP